MFVKHLTRPIDDFLPRVTANVNSIDQDMVRSFVTDAVIQFCRESRLIKRFATFFIEPCISTYLLPEIDKHERVSEITGFKLFHAGQHVPHLDVPYYVDDSNTLHINNLPNWQKMAVQVSYSVVPKRDSELVYEVLYEDWVDAITHLTLHKLFMLSGTDWFNPNLAELHHRQYQQLLKAARVHNISKHNHLNVQLAPKYGRRY